MTTKESIEREFRKSFVEMSIGRDMHNRPPLYETDLEDVSDIISFFSSKYGQLLREKIEEIMEAIKDDTKFSQDNRVPPQNKAYQKALFILKGFPVE